MSDFIRECLCQGFRPRFLDGAGSRMRPRPLSELMRERDVARFLVAPTGYGKTSVLSQYAQTMFSFEHVIWATCGDPRFLRDLDKGNLDDVALMTDPSLALVVFDDVPLLSEQRALAFSEAMDGLLERGVEVLVACTPSCDAFSGLQIDRQRLTASDLVLTDDDLASLDALASVARARFRTPAEVFLGKDAARTLMAGIVREHLGGTELACAFALLLMGKGSLADVRSAVPGVSDSCFSQLAADYPFLGLNVHAATFDALEAAPGEVVHVFQGSSLQLAEAAGCESLSDFGAAVGSALVRSGAADRACAVVQAVCEKSDRVSWAQSHGATFLSAGDLASPSGLCEEAGLSEHSPAEACLQQAVRLALLGDGARACVRARQALRNPLSHDGQRAGAALVLLRFSRFRVREAEAVARRLAGEGASADPWTACLTVDRAFSRGLRQAVAAWNGLCDRGADTVQLLMSAGWLCMLTGGAGGLSLLEREGCAQAVELLRGCLDAGSVEGASDAVARLATLLCCLDASGSLVGAAASEEHPAMQVALDDLRVQRARWASLSRRLPDADAAGLDGHRAGGFSLAGSGDGSADSDAERHTLRVELLGGVRAFVDDVACSGFLRLTKVRSLLALMCMDPRREWTRERLAEALWPGLPFDAGRKRLYTVWSRLSTTLQTADGSCPFLVKLQDGYGMANDLVTVDVHEASSTLETFHFDAVKPEEWTASLRELHRSYVGDVVPGEMEVEEIVRFRESFARRRVDGLVAGSVRLLAAGCPSEALKFAQAAHFLDTRREDVYSALLAAQIECGMRPEGIATFVSYRRFMADELGIDPSAEMARLYRSLLQSEEEF